MHKYNLSIQIEHSENIIDIVKKLKLKITTKNNYFKLETQGTSLNLVSKIIKKEILNIDPNVVNIVINLQ